ncbi:Ion transport [Cordyceps militaris CM01]|uniref:Ion transport n=1 Tax=Cordyceps militaris (strain CM01) TaxID=983644 RepID=G3JM74_CORMM|nr:Ion transport [Cordyceps militaris CM01]EGX90798.1 Ion transport [Cordyceps militaris CM01]
MGALPSKLRGGLSTRDAVAYTVPTSAMVAAFARQGADMTRDESVDSAPSDHPLPVIDDVDDFRSIIKKLSIYFCSVIELPSTFEQLRTTSAGACLRDLANHLAETCQNPLIVNALLALKWHYDADTHEQTLSDSRASACEIVAWRFLAQKSDVDAMRFCLHEIPGLRAGPRREDRGRSDEEAQQPGESTPLLHRAKTNPDGEYGVRRRHAHATAHAATSSRHSLRLESFSLAANDAETASADGEADPAEVFRTLNALEVAVVAGAKRFLGRNVVQRIVTGIWHGEIIFWDSLSVHATKTPRLYDPDKTDIYSRLRVPKYLKTFEAFFFLIFLYLYYSVLIQRVTERITATEAVLWVWIAAFCYDEFSEWLDAGSVFYVTDIWNVCDLIMMLLGCIFAALRITGVIQQSTAINNTAFDILALEALFLVPRMCSLLSLNPSWGILIPCLKEMTMDFLKFMVIILIIYCGFLTTFSLLGRDHFTLVRMAGVLGKIFFGSSYVGFDIMHEIDPYFGPPLMIVFITLSTFLLMGSLAGLLANSFARVMNEAHVEYVYVYSIYVLEASTSNRLTHFYPPFNLLALLLFRPWRLVLRGDEAFRGARIWLLKATHTPIVAVIALYEMMTRRSTVKGLPQLAGSILDASEGLRRPESRIGADRAETGRRRTKRRRAVLHSQERTAVEQEPGDAHRVALEIQIGELNKMKGREESRIDSQDL